MVTPVQEETVAITVSEVYIQNSWGKNVGTFSYPKDGESRTKEGRKTYCHRNCTLAPDFAEFTAPHAVWQAESQEDKDAAFGEFLAHTVRRKRIATVTSSNGVLTLPARLDIARKPG